MYKEVCLFHRSMIYREKFSYIENILAVMIRMANEGNFEEFHTS